MNFTKSSFKDIPATISLWQEVFGDSEDFIRRFIAHFGIENCRICKLDGEIAAMAFALPATLSSFLPFSLSKLYYIYACATRPCYRRQGVMAKLIDVIFEEACSENMAGIFLRPADEHLANYYRNLGFEDLFYSKKSFIYRKEHKECTKGAMRFCADSNALRNLCKTSRTLWVTIPPETYYKKRINKLENCNFIHWNEDFFRFNSEAGIRFCEMENTIFSFHIQDGKITVEELLGEKSPLQLANYLFSQFPNITIVEINTPGNETCCGQIKWRNPLEQKLKNVYFAFGME